MRKPFLAINSCSDQWRSAPLYRDVIFFGSTVVYIQYVHLKIVYTHTPLHISLHLKINYTEVNSNNVHKDAGSKRSTLFVILGIGGGKRASHRVSKSKSRFTPLPKQFGRGQVNICERFLGRFWELCNIIRKRIVTILYNSFNMCLP